MSPSEDTSRKSRTLVCPNCGKQFLTYQTGRTPHCPRCDKPVRERSLGRVLLLLVLVVLVAVGAAAGYFYLARR
ncbi:MAG: hypothetical protein R6V05_12460 [Candidatus Brocadiia bacterium]